jgi:hypothetical protein
MLTPEENKWVEAEYQNLKSGDNKNTPRITKFVNCKERAIYETRKYIEEIQNLIKNLKLNEDPKKETLVWIMIVDQLYRSENSPVSSGFSKLIAEDIIDKEILKNGKIGILCLSGPRNSDVQLLWPFWAASIMDKFLFAKLTNDLEVQKNEN